MVTTINNNKLNVAIIVLQEAGDRGRDAWMKAVEEFQTTHYHLLALARATWLTGKNLPG